MIKTIECMGLALLIFLRLPAHAANQHDYHVNRTIVLRDHSPKQIEWYDDGPFPPVDAHNPPQYVRGIVVRERAEPQRVVAQWQARPTTLKIFYPRLNNVWRTHADESGPLISVAVQYGGKVLDLYMLEFRGNGLKQVGHWEDLDMSIMEMKNHLVVEVIPGAYYQVPKLFRWTRAGFIRADHEFPVFYARLGRRYIAEIYSDHPAVAEDIAANCRLASAAWRLAKDPARGVRACRAAKQRIASGRGIVPGSSRETPQEFMAERKHAIKQIDALLTGRHMRL